MASVGKVVGSAVIFAIGIAGSQAFFSLGPYQTLKSARAAIERDSYGRPKPRKIEAVASEQRKHEDVDGSQHIMWRINCE